MDALEILSGIDRNLIVAENTILKNDVDNQSDMTEILNNLFTMVENFYSYIKVCDDEKKDIFLKENIATLQIYLQRINKIKIFLEDRKKIVEENINSKKDVSIAIKSYTDNY